MTLSQAQLDRAGGVLLGQAVGDALGVPYEFAPRIPVGQARMIGGGLGPYAPGEWSDDTQMAVCVARELTGGFHGEPTLRAIAEAFLGWLDDGATDVGNLTRSVLSSARHQWDLLAAMHRAATQAAAADQAGNGALMRTAVVGLIAPDDRVRTAEASAQIAALTHAHHLCVESSVLWSEAVRLAVMEETLDVRAGLDLLAADRRNDWHDLLDQAQSRPPESFNPNGFTVHALQAAWSAIHATRHESGTAHVEAALQTAVAIGHDTDTVAAIAGGLLGACYGVAAIPAEQAAAVHGWPGLGGADLVELGRRIAAGPIDR
ncbi:ADP-ribosylglycohydrolase family protein [Granulicoccus phenolivorans]|uniref:ADP-ribosylglycohydrolase family protein n=1 Tax=Granulicoccus phenolivorans TaxID=266854 RepID=UPI0004072A22|nr:ADP-ribosylglycohydrolase family protein [Granulicoccus phenolivorans]